MWEWRTHQDKMDKDMYNNPIYENRTVQHLLRGKIVYAEAKYVSTRTTDRTHQLNA